MRATTSSRLRFVGAFSLIELLLVIAILMLLTSMAQMALNDVSNSTKMSTASQQVGDTFNLARQIAVAQNTYVQVRLFAPKDAAGKYSAIGIYRCDMPYYLSSYADLESSGKIRREGKIRKLPEQVVMWSSDQYSSLVDILEKDTLRKGGSIKIDGKEYDWVSFYFRPDGGTDVSLPVNSTDNFATMTVVSSVGLKDNKLPANYATLTIDPVNGRFRVFRP